MNKQLIEIEVTPTGMQAYVMINPDFKQQDDPEAGLVVPEVSSIVAALKQKGVKFGIDEKVIKSIIDEKKWGERVLVAHGTLSKRGEDGSIEYTFNTSDVPKPKELENGRVDFHEIGLVTFVKKGDVLARRTPAKPGIAGKTVTGEPVPADPGSDVFIISGANTAFYGSGDLELRATETGSVKLVSGAVTVEKSLHLNKGVNFATGNIDFPGDVLITGDIKSGFTIKATGKLEIQGIVEDAEVYADGDIMVKGGFTGTGKGKITSKGDIYLKYVDNQVIEAEGSITITEACVQAQVNAGKDVDVSAGAGRIVGGHIRSGGTITVKTLGNDQNLKTIVELCAAGGEFKAKLKAKESAISLQKEKINEVKNIMRKLQQQKAEAEGETRVFLDKIRVCQDKAHELDEALKNMEEDLNRFHVTGACNGQIHILRTAFPGSQIVIGRESITIQEQRKESIFIKEYDEIIDKKAKKQED